MVQLGFYFHMKRAIGQGVLGGLTRPLAFAICFMLFVSIVIALFKDIPDIKGDRQVGVRSGNRAASLSHPPPCVGGDSL
jgi:homogentisate phytyltransferase / homogentisate geranylgeranyltransferase